MADEDWAAEVDEQERQITGQVSDMPSISHLENTWESSRFYRDCCRLSLQKTALKIAVQLNSLIKGHLNK